MTRLLDITNQTHRWTEQNIHIDTNDIYTYQIDGPTRQIVRSN